MIAKPIRSAFFAAVAVFLAAVTAAPFAAFAQEPDRDAQDTNDAKADEYFRDALDYRKKMETELHALEQDPAADRKQIDQMRQNLVLFDQLLKNAKAQLANGAMSLSLGPVVNRPAMQTVPWLTIISDDATRMSESAAAKDEGGQNKRDVLAGAPLWDTKRDGQPELRLRELVDAAAKRAEADLSSLGSVRVTSADAAHSCADVDFTVVDEYGKIVRFIDEIEKSTPRLAWRRIELRIEPAVRTLAGDKPKTDASPADDVRKIRMMGMIRVVMKKDAPAKNESVPADDAAGTAKEMAKKPVSISFGDPDFLAKLYDLSLALPDDALVTGFRFNNGNCDLTIQTQNRTNPAEYMIFPYWKIVRLTQRIIANGVYSFSISLVRKDDPAQPQKDSVTPENKAATIAARNIFDPDRTPKKTVKSGGSAVAPGSNGARPDNLADLERQLQEALKTRAELESLLQTLQSTPGVTNEQTGLLRQRLERAEREIELIREQLKALRP